MVMRRYFNPKTAFLLLLVLLAACNSGSSAPDEAVPQIESDRIILPNQGGNMEGHTPRGFQGMGTGLFTGDNLNSRFPEGDGVQIFLTFDLSDVPPGKIASATLRSVRARIEGTPFEDLGPLVAEEVRYDTFSPALWNLVPETNGTSCDFATSPEGPFVCDVTSIVNRSREDGYRYAQFRLRMARAGDNDGLQDMVFFFISEPNANQAGIFELELARPAQSSAPEISTAEAVADNGQARPTELPVSTSVQAKQEPPPSGVSSPSRATARVLAAGEFDLPAAAAFGAPGFHETYNFSHTIPAELERAADQNLVVTVWDASRSGQRCSSEPPLSGCATIDWSDAESRPNVPPGGVFDNSLTVQLASGTRTYFLSELDGLAGEPDAYDPG
jgi:hypothetical protein